MLHGPQREVFDLQFAVPSECADRLAAGTAEIGIVPCAELERLGLQAFLDVGIACRGAVRSILLISRVDPGDIRTLAADVSSRTSVQLSRIILARRYNAYPVIQPMSPDLPAMLEYADAALIIGDPALKTDPANLPFHVLDLGHEWQRLTGLPMVFAVWAGLPAVMTDEARVAFIESARYGMDRMDEIVRHAELNLGVRADLAREYLTRHIVFELDDSERAGLKLFQQYASELSRADRLREIRA